MVLLSFARCGSCEYGSLDDPAACPREPHSWMDPADEAHWHRLNGEGPIPFGLCGCPCASGPGDTPRLGDPTSPT